MRHELYGLYSWTMKFQHWKHCQSSLKSTVGLAFSIIINSVKLICSVISSILKWGYALSQCDNCCLSYMRFVWYTRCMVYTRWYTQVLTNWSALRLMHAADIFSSWRTKKKVKKLDVKQRQMSQSQENIQKPRKTQTFQRGHWKARKDSKKKTRKDLKKKSQEKLTWQFVSRTQCSFSFSCFIFHLLMEGLIILKLVSDFVQFFGGDHCKLVWLEFLILFCFLGEFQ